MRAPEQLSTWYATRTPPARAALMLVPVLLVASLLRLTGLIGDQPGFRHEEASVALAAKQIERGHFPIYFRQGQETVEPAFAYLVNITGQLAGWGVDGPRLAAALLGIVAAIGCSLWYRQSLGAGWGLAGGLLVATSFWQIAFSRQAVPSIAMAAAGALGLWALFQAIEQRRARTPWSMPSGWFGLAGLLFGIGFYTDVAMRTVIPVVLVLGLFLAFRRGYLHQAADRRGLILGGAVMLLVAAPLGSYFAQNPDIFRLGVQNLRSSGSLAEHLGKTLSAIVWSGELNPAHTLAGQPLLDPVLVVWGAVGLAVALRRPLTALHFTALVWLAGFLVAIVAVAPGNHAQMLVLTPVLFLLPLLGMRAVLAEARRRGSTLANVVLAIIVLSIAGSATWSAVTYSHWTASEETYRAFAGDVRDAVSALEDLSADNILAYFSTGEQGRIIRYLAPERPRRDFNNPSTLPMPATGPAYLIVPASAGPPDPLRFYLGDETLVTTGIGPGAEPSYRVWLIDDRVRERLPYAVPGIFFEDGPTLVGFEVAPLAGTLEGPAIDVVLIHRVRADSDPFLAVLRLVELDGEADDPAGSLIQPAPAAGVFRDEIVLSRISLPFPDTPGMVADLQTAVQRTDGEYLRPYGPNVLVIGDTFALLNAIGYIGPEP